MQRTRRKRLGPDLGPFGNFPRKNPFMVPAMLQCGNRLGLRVPVQHRPPNGGIFQRERLAPVRCLGFNLNKVG
jgi:hypothetical protein